MVKVNCDIFLYVTVEVIHFDNLCFDCISSRLCTTVIVVGHYTLIVGTYQQDKNIKDLNVSIVMLDGSKGST